VAVCFNRASSSSGFGPRGGGVSKGGGGSTAGSGGYAPRGSVGGSSFSDAGFRMAAAYVQQHLLGQQHGSDGC
jgi:hypothetical protein